jgi:hypothetical protein
MRCSSIQLAHIRIPAFKFKVDAVLPIRQLGCEFVEIAELSQQVPRHFLKLGCGSLEGICDTTFQVKEWNPPNLEEPDGELDIGADFNGFGRIIKLHKDDTERPVYGIDASNICLGETGEGILWAFRGVIVWREDGEYRYVRHGPFIFHVTEGNKGALYNTLHQLYFDSDRWVSAPTVDRMGNRIRDVLERWLQKQVCLSSRGALILWDGSLTTRTVNSPISVLNDLLRAARERLNTVLAFSKKTAITVSGRRVNDLLDDRDTPCLLDIDESARSRYSNQLHFFGRIYASKLAPSHFTFRMDIDRGIPFEEGIGAVQILLGNDLIVENYPETLRLAHILSRFSEGEVIGMQRYVADNYGLKVIYRLDVRQVLFGPYGGFSPMRKGVTPDYDAGL